MKTCIKCVIEKNLSEFSRDCHKKDGLSNICKSCRKLYRIKYKRSKEGLATIIYSQQKNKSKKRGMLPPCYTIEEFKLWLISQSNFGYLFEKWVNSNYNTGMIPSVDRLNDYKTYSFDNIRLVTWEENNTKAHMDRKNGKNNKASKTVVKYDLNNNKIEEYYSGAEALRRTGIRHISECCVGEVKTAGGYIWKFKEL